MLLSVKSLLGSVIEAKDGTLGTVKGYYFDDNQFAVRYLVVATEGVGGRTQMLLSPSALKDPDWQTRQFRTELLHEEVARSPRVDFGEEISPDQEEAVTSYFGWPNYWDSIAVEKGLQTETAAAGYTVLIDRRSIYHLLRPAVKLMDFTVKAIDQEIGKVSDLIVDDLDWQIDYMEVTTGDWLQGRKVILSPEWVENVDWDNNRLNVRMSKASIKDSPVFTSLPVTDEYENELYAYYGLERGDRNSDLGKP